MRDVLQRGAKILGRIVAVETQHGLAALVEKQQRRRILHLQRRGKGFFGENLAADADNLAVAPHVQRDAVEVIDDVGLDCRVGEVFLDQARAVRAALLVEIQHDALAGRGGLGDVFLELEKALLEPVRLLRRDGAEILALLVFAGAGGEGREQQRKDSDSAADILAKTGH